MKITDHQKSLLSMLSDGVKIKQIASKKLMSVRSIEHTLSELRFEYDCANTTALVAYAIRNKIIN